MACATLTMDVWTTFLRVPVFGPWPRLVPVAGIVVIRAPRSYWSATLVTLIGNFSIRGR